MPENEYVLYPLGFLQSPLKEPGEAPRQVGQYLVMLLWHEQAMAGEKWPLVQKSQGEAVFKDQGGLFLMADDATERAGCAFVWSVSRNI